MTLNVKLTVQIGVVFAFNLLIPLRKSDCFMGTLERIWSIVTTYRGVTVEPNGHSEKTLKCYVGHLTVTKCTQADSSTERFTYSNSHNCNPLHMY